MFDLLYVKLYNRTVEKDRVQRLTPVELAFIGDAVYTLYMRERVIINSAGVIGTLHTAVSRLVNATAQAAVLDKLYAKGIMTEDELDTARRAKNAHLHSRTKAATVGDYHKATALEAVIGYVHVSGDAEREKYLLELCAELSDSQKNKRISTT